jgi:hypothetical protein
VNGSDLASVYRLLYRVSVLELAHLDLVLAEVVEDVLVLDEGGVHDDLGTVACIIEIYKE